MKTQQMQEQEHTKGGVKIINMHIPLSHQLQ